MERKLITEREITELIGDKEKEYRELIYQRDYFIRSHKEIKEKVEKKAMYLSKKLDSLVLAIEKTERDLENTIYLDTELATEYRRKVYEGIVKHCYQNRRFRDPSKIDSYNFRINISDYDPRIKNFKRLFSSVNSEEIKKIQTNIKINEFWIAETKKEIENLYQRYDPSNDEKILKALELEKEACELRGIQSNTNEIEKQKQLIKERKEESQRKEIETSDFRKDLSGSVERRENEIGHEKEEIIFLQNGYEVEEVRSIIKKGLEYLCKGYKGGNIGGFLGIYPNENEKRYIKIISEKKEITCVRDKLEKMENLGEFIYILLIADNGVYCNPW